MSFIDRTCVSPIEIVCGLERFYSSCIPKTRRSMPAEAVPIIDAHQHFWHYTAADYGWIDDSMAVLRRDFLPADLAAAMHSAGVARSIAVQARQSVEETDWLLELARQDNIIA